MKDRLKMYHALPEKSIGEIRAKVNCYQAEAIDIRNRAKALLREADLYDSWAQITFMRLRDAIIAGLIK